MTSLYLRENLTFDQARVQVLHEGKDGKRTSRPSNRCRGLSELGERLSSMGSPAGESASGGNSAGSSGGGASVRGGQRKQRATVAAGQLLRYIGLFV